MKFDMNSEKIPKAGMYAIQTDHPGLDPAVFKKKKMTKGSRSIFMNDEDASKQYITNIEEKINIRLKEMK